MQFLAGFLILCFIISVLGPWFWVLLGLGIVGYIVYRVTSETHEASLPEEERKALRRQRQEEQHARRMATIEHQKHAAQLEAQKKAQASAAKRSIGGVIAKTAVSVGLHALTNGAVKHRHRH